MCIQGVNEFTCDCRGTNYTGMTCEKGIVRTPVIPVLTKGETQILSLSTNLDITSPIKVNIEVDKTPTTVYISTQTQNVSFTVTPKRAGTIKVAYDPVGSYVAQPSVSTVLVRGESEIVHPTNHYFTTLQQQIGTLKKGCCGLANLVFSCPEDALSVHLKSGCQWRTSQSSYSTPGVVFAEGGALSLPISITGYAIRKARRLNSQIPSLRRECTSCAANLCNKRPPSNETCYCYDFVSSDTINLLNVHSLGMTFLQGISRLLPQWLNLWIDLNNVQPDTMALDYGLFVPLVDREKRIRNRDGCENIFPISNGIYSIMRLGNTLSGEIDGETYVYNGVNDGDPMCFVVNMCKELSSPVYMQPSQPIQNLLSNEYLQSFTSMGWIFRLDSITVFKFPQHQNIESLFWNSSQYFSPRRVVYDLAISTTTEALFSSTTLNISFSFSGQAFLEHEVSHILLYSNVTLCNVTVIHAVFFLLTIE